MTKLRILAVLFAFSLLTSCTDLGPTGPQEEECQENSCGGLIGSGN